MLGVGSACMAVVGVTVAAIGSSMLVVWFLGQWWCLIAPAYLGWDLRVIWWLLHLWWQVAPACIGFDILAWWWLVASSSAALAFLKFRRDS